MPVDEETGSATLQNHKNLILTKTLSKSNDTNITGIPQEKDESSTSGTPGLNERQ